MKRLAMLGSILVVTLAFAGPRGAAQAPAQQPTPQPTTPQPTPSTNPDKTKPTDVTPLSTDNSAPPVNAEEDAAVKAFRDAPVSDVAKKDQLGEDFVQKYPQSRYRAEVYSWLVKGYLSQGQIDKMEVAGDKELEIMPNDVSTLAIMGSMLPRAMNAKTPEPEKRLDKAEAYSKKALELLPTLTKPNDISEADFMKSKNQVSALAYGGLGLVAFRRQKYTEAIPNLEQATRLDPTSDPVNYYLLGVANEKALHWDDAITAFTKCSQIPGGMQETCKSKIDEAKKLAATQLSAPK
jgi:tetratricopeptide (TPR) repeat protein